MKKKHDQRSLHSTNTNTVITDKAHTLAEKDMAKDPDLKIHQKNNDLDEGELARLGKDGPGIQ